MPTYDPLQSYTWATSTSPNSDYGSRAYIEHIRRQREQMARQEAAQRQQQMEMEARQRAEIDARVRDFQASITDQSLPPPAPTIEELRARAQVFRGEPPTRIGFDTFRNQGRRIPYEPVNKLDPVINNPEKPGRSPF
jgi:uncharacterized sporulation protein YeaH/YhbH (DUF444 family)